MLVMESSPSLDFEPAGVRGAECTTETGGDILDEDSPDSAGGCFRSCVAVPDAGSEPGKDKGSKAWCCMREVCRLFFDNAVSSCCNSCVASSFPRSAWAS